jgi:hypothetical protein
MTTSTFANSLSAGAVLPPAGEDISKWIIAGGVAPKQQNTGLVAAWRDRPSKVA